MLKATLKASVTGTLTGSNDLGDAVQTFAELVEIAITDGTGANQANNVFSDARTLGASRPRTSIFPACLTNALGATLAFTAIKAILIVADARNTNNVEVGGAASNGFVGPFADATDKIVDGPGRRFPDHPPFGRRHGGRRRYRRHPQGRQQRRRFGGHLQDHHHRRSLMPAARGWRSPPQDHHPASDESQNQDRRIPDRLGRLCDGRQLRSPRSTAAKWSWTRCCKASRPTACGSAGAATLRPRTSCVGRDGCFGYDAKGGKRDLNIRSAVDPDGRRDAAADHRRHRLNEDLNHGEHLPPKPHVSKKLAGELAALGLSLDHDGLVTLTMLTGASGEGLQRREGRGAPLRSGDGRALREDAHRPAGPRSAVTCKLRRSTAWPPRIRYSATFPRRRASSSASRSRGSATTSSPRKRRTSPRGPESLNRASA
jgi:hypothetical protein